MNGLIFFCIGCMLVNPSEVVIMPSFRERKGQIYVMSLEWLVRPEIKS